MPASLSPWVPVLLVLLVLLALLSSPGSAGEVDPAGWLEAWRRRHLGNLSAGALPECGGRARCVMPQFLPARDRPKHPQAIPRILWQSGYPQQVRPKQFSLMQRLAARNPTYEYLLFTDADWRRMVCDLGDEELQRSFSLLKHRQARAFLGRLFALYTFGGVFVEGKVSARDPFDDYFLPNASVVSGRDAAGSLHLHTMAYAPRHPFIRQTLEAVVPLIQSEYSNWRVGSLTELLTKPFHSSVNYVLSRNGCTLKPASCSNESHPESLGSLQILSGNWMDGHVEVDKEVHSMQKAKLPSSPRDLFSSRHSQDRCESKGAVGSLSKPKLLGAAVYLLTERVRRDFSPRGDRNCGFNMSMNFLVKNWQPHNPYPVVLMAETPWSDVEVEAIRALWPSLEIYFVCVATDFEMYSEKDKFEDFEKPLSSLSYKRMCAFWFSGFLNVPIIADFRYILRLDDDSCIRSSVNYDIFKELEARGAHYAFRELGGDPDFVVRGLYDFLDKYVSERRIKVTHPRLFNQTMKSLSINPFPMFLTNFEVIDTHRFRAPDIVDFSQYVADSKMIFHRRWGDAPLRMAQALMFLERDSIFSTCDFEYVHSAWRPFFPCERRISHNSLAKLMHPLFFQLWG